MRVLIACEFSGRVRDAFIRHGHDAVSCDLLDTELPGPHIKDDVRNHLDKGWDLMIAHPPCTHLCASGARWWKDKQKEQSEAIRFVNVLLNAPIERIALENPIGILSKIFGKPTQIIQPWWFGHDETKATCLWLKNLPKLVKTNAVEGKWARSHTEKPGPDRWKARSRTPLLIAEAFASQWSNL